MMLQLVIKASDGNAQVLRVKANQYYVDRNNGALVIAARDEAGKIEQLMTYAPGHWISLVDLEACAGRVEMLVEGETGPKWATVPFHQ